MYTADLRFAIHITLYLIVSFIALIAHHFRRERTLAFILQNKCIHCGFAIVFFFHNCDKREGENIGMLYFFVCLYSVTHLPLQSENFFIGSSLFKPVFFFSVLLLQTLCLLQTLRAPSYTTEKRTKRLLIFTLHAFPVFFTL